MNQGSNNVVQNLTEAPVSTYIGDTPIFLNIALTDIERVELLRGPQGTLYGSGSVGGAVRYLFNKPNLDALAVLVTLVVDFFSLTFTRHF